MRSLELLLWVAAAGWSAWLLVLPPARAANLVLMTVTATIALLQLFVEGARFHLIPTYALLLGLGLAALSRRRSDGDRQPQPRWVRIVAGILMAAWLLIAAALPSMFPVYAYEKLDGPYGVGTTAYTVQDPSQERDLVVQVWYPVAATAQGAPAEISPRPDRLAVAYASFTGLPKPFFDHLRLVRTHAIAETRLADDRPNFPVVLFSHGPLSANRSQSIFQMEALATHGFVVAAIDHTGYAATTIFPDGHEVLPGARASFPVFVDDRSTSMVRTWVMDVRRVIDHLEALNVNDPNRLLTGRLDMARLGYLGVSFGGSVVVQALLDEPRIKAGVAEDGKPYFFDDTLHNLRRPLMYMQSASPYIASSDAQLAKWNVTAASFKLAEQDHYARLMQLFGSTLGPIHNVYIRGTNHVTFSDLYLMLRWPDSQLMDIRRAHRIINGYTVAFFERYLNCVSQRLVDGASPSPFAEVVASSRNTTPAERVAGAAGKD